MDPIVNAVRAVLGAKGADVEVTIRSNASVNAETQKVLDAMPPELQDEFKASLARGPVAPRRPTTYSLPRRR